VGQFLLRRAVMLGITVLVVSVLAFLFPYLGGGDPARTIMRSRVADIAVDPATVDALRVQLGLDRPLAVQYLAWLGQALRGDLGFSFASRLPVSGEIFRALLVSAILALTALVVALGLAVPLGTNAARKPGEMADNLTSLVAQSFVATPEYLLAPVAILVFAVHLRWLPSAGWRGPESVVLPAFVLMLRPLAYFTQIIRASMVEVLRAPYITAARSRGLSMGQTLLRHGIRNGIMPVVTLFSLWLASLLGGAVVVEVIFAVPGMGRLVYDAIVNNDVPMLQGGVVCTVALSVLINTVTDFIYVAINPTMKLPHDAG
jgi:peptide/nickel transport system permease protein